jgi:hypothetical protein
VSFDGVAGAGGPHIWLAFLAGWSLGTFLIVMICMPLKYVGIENGELVVSNYWTDRRVPFSRISDVKQGNSINLRPIMIVLKKDVGCGLTVLFMPLAQTMLTTTRGDRELEELRQLAGLPIGGSASS